MRRSYNRQWGFMVWFMPEGTPGPHGADFPAGGEAMRGDHGREIRDPLLFLIMKWHTGPRGRRGKKPRETVTRTL